MGALASPHDFTASKILLSSRKQTTNFHTE